MSHQPAPDHARWADSVASYALGALPDAEVAGFQEHLEQCDACRAELQELAPAVAALPTSVPPRAAPDRLRDRVLAEVRSEAALLRAAGPEADQPAAVRRPRRRRRLAAWAVPVAAALAIGFTVGRLADAGDRTVAFATAGAARDADAHLVISDGRAVLEARDLAAPPPGRVYQVWIQHNGEAPQPTSALFVPRADGTASVAVSSADADVVMVSAEPPGGSPAPTTPPILTADLAS